MPDRMAVFALRVYSRGTAASVAQGGRRKYLKLRGKSSKRIHHGDRPTQPGCRMRRREINSGLVLVEFTGRVRQNRPPKYPTSIHTDSIQFHRSLMVVGAAGFEPATS